MGCPLYYQTKSCIILFVRGWCRDFDYRILECPKKVYKFIEAAVEEYNNYEFAEPKYK